MRYLVLEEVLELHRRIIFRTGGSSGIRDLGALKSAVAQPQMTFDSIDLYLTIEEKAAALGYSLICNHPFVDGNKRLGHAAIECFLILNGYQLEASVEESEKIILSVAAGACARGDFLIWIKSHLEEK
jgi:death on curing protein